MGKKVQKTTGITIQGALFAAKTPYKNKGGDFYHMLRVCFNSYGSYTTDQVYQWDQNLTLHIIGLNLDYSPAIHFANKKSTEAMVVHSTKDGDDITAPVPNLLLQEPYNIIAYIHIYDVDDENAKTIEVINIPLIKRLKPSEYQFEDNVDIMNFERLETDIADFIATMTEDFETYKAELQEEIETKETNIKNYADERDLFWVENVLDNTHVSIENGDKDTLEEAKSYSDTNLETAKTYSDENLASAKTFANTNVLEATISSARAYADGKDGINLESAKTYTDSKVSEIESHFYSTLDTTKIFESVEEGVTMSMVYLTVAGNMATIGGRAEVASYSSGMGLFKLVSKLEPYRSVIYCAPYTYSSGTGAVPSKWQTSGRIIKHYGGTAGQKLTIDFSMTFGLANMYTT